MESLELYSSIVEAQLTKDIDFVKDGQNIRIAKGKIVMVDTLKGVALFGNDHFQIDEDEYVAVFQN